jgi:hypothetical protein
MLGTTYTIYWLLSFWYYKNNNPPAMQIATGPENDSSVALYASTDDIFALLSLCTFSNNDNDLANKVPNIGQLNITYSTNDINILRMSTSEIQVVYNRLNVCRWL